MKILVGMSGGVDSTVAALLLKRAGHEVIGATMTIWDKNMRNLHPDGRDACFGPHEEKDIPIAREICRKLDIPYYVFDCREEYKRLVLSNFRKDYLNGFTPNPCIWCNATIKFDVLPNTARQQGLDFDKFATGHYARLDINPQSHRYFLRSATNLRKDQSYFLYRLQQEQLSRIMLPLGEYDKTEIRQICKEADLGVFDKADSQDFYAGDYADLLDATPKTGNFVTTDGKILGQHQGFWNFTIGQRRGLGVSSDRPLYVIALNKDTNEVILGHEEESFKSILEAENCNWMDFDLPDSPFEALAKVRSSQTPVNVTVTKIPTGIRVEFADMQKALTPGQSIVLYQGDIVLGGGIIKKIVA